MRLIRRYFALHYPIPYYPIITSLCCQFCELVIIIIATMVRDMGVKKNIHIENWASYRENCEHYFKFSQANWRRLAVFGFAVPVLLYIGITNEFVSCSLLPV